MNLFNMLLNDPVVLFAFAGLAIVLGICTFYVFYFINNIENNK
jgi:hypothetical protein